MLKNILIIIFLILLTREGHCFLSRGEFDQVIPVKSSWNIYLYGGIPWHDLATREVVQLVLCHELGHYLGGAPMMRIRLPVDDRGASALISAEGEADYYATAKCMRHFNFDRDTVIKASVDLLTILSAIDNQEVPSIDDFDPNVVDVMVPALHPSSQCRLDTLINGFDCPISADTPLSQTNLSQGACMAHSTNIAESINARPRCWFKP